MVGINEICKYLPHHYPLLLMDRMVELDIEGRRIRTYKNVSINESFFNGHFPEHPIMPDILIIEVMAQAADTLGFRIPDAKPADDTLYYFVGSNKLCFRQPALPDDQLQLHTRFVSVERNIWRSDCHATVNNKPVYSAEIICAERKL